MSILKSGIATWITAGLGLFGANLAHADYQQRLSLGIGFVTMDHPSQTEFEIGAEYEYRTSEIWGWGVSGNYIFSDPSIVLLAVPQVSLHPFASEFLVSAAPLVEFGSGINTAVGARLGTRVPLSLGVLTLVPSFGIDFIHGGRDYLFGIGIEF